MCRHLLKILIITFLILDFPACFSQLPDNFPVIDKNDIPDAKFLSVRTFNGSSLFGYINGGAELYLEYGFDVVSVSELEYKGGRYKTEIYKMNGAEEAFGIFSVSKYVCTGIPDLSKITCQNKYQLQICKGPYYINIINSTGTRSDSIGSLFIGRLITEKIGESEADFSSWLPDIPVEKIRTKCLLAKGRLGIVNGSPDLEDFFQGITDYTAMILNDPGNTTISVKFQNKESYNRFITHHGLPDKSFKNEAIKWSNGTVSKIAENWLLLEIQKQ